MNATERFVAVLDSARAYLKLYETELDSENLSDETNARTDARHRLKIAVESWDGA